MRSAASVLAVVAATGIAACGSSSPNPGVGKRDAMVAFAKCMRANGVPNFPDPGSNGRGGLIISQQRRAGSGASLTINGAAVSSPAFQSGMQHCQSKLPNGGHPPAPSASQRAAMLKFARCMRAHGVTNFPDPSFGSAGAPKLELGQSSGLAPNSPAFQSAMKQCGGPGKSVFRVADRAG